jgi:hypothetical protein
MRVHAPLRARLIDRAGVSRAIELVNLSVVGLRARSDEALEAGTRQMLELSSGEERIEAHGTIVRAEGTTLALRFDVLPFECFERLRSLLLARADDPVVLQDELSDRLGFLGETA